MGSFKAPCPDGYHHFLYKKYWEVIKVDLCDFIRNIFADLCIPSNINNTQIVIIPKIQSPSSISQFRSISLCNKIYKIIAKLLANRLRVSLPSRISPNQNSFLPGRGTDTNVIIANEILHSMNARKGKGRWFILKLDLEKAYDKLEGGFIKNCLLFYGLDQAFVNMIMNCVSTISSTVLVNGIPADSFSPSRGIRQGDPLSPYLFIICMEVLSFLIHDAGVKVSGPRFLCVGKRFPSSFCR